MARFESETLQKVLEALGKLANVNVMFDEGFRDSSKKVSLRLGGLTFVELLDRITLVHKLFYKVLDANTILIVPESRQNRIRYDEQMLRTFYLQNAEVDETMNMVKTMTKVTTIASNKALGAITILGTADQIAMADRIIAANDKARGEIVVEVQILEVNRRAVRKWGLDIASYSAAATLSPTGSDGEVSDAGVLNLRAHLLSSLNQGDWVVSVPARLLTQFLQTDDTSRVLASPRLRAAEGKKTELEIGTEIPIPVTSIGVGLGNQQSGALGGYYPSTSFQYKTVGVTMGLEPRVAASGDITVQVDAKFSILGGDRNVGSETNKLLVPTFLSRGVKATLRLRDGETGLIGGLLQGGESRTFSGVLGVNNLPILGKLFGSRSNTVEDSEILISITPTIVRGPKLVEEDFTPLRVGTQEVPRVEGARANPFGPEPTTTAEKPAPEPAPPVHQRPAQPASTTPETVPPPSPPAAEPPLEIPAPPTTLSPAEPPPGASSLAPTSPATEPSRPPQAGAPSAPVAPSAQASATVLLSPAEVSVKVGQSAGMAVVLVGAKGVEWVEMTLVYDPQAVELTDASAGPLLTLDGAPVQTERSSNPGRLRVRFSRTTPIAGSGSVVAVTVKGLKPGTSAMALADLHVGRAGGSESPVAPSPGQVVVTP
jgi:general secretion pathway protein D